MGSYFETIRECKETIPNNGVHQQDQPNFSRFLELKREYESNKTTHINFSETVLLTTLMKMIVLTLITRNNIFLYFS